MAEAPERKGSPDASSRMCVASRERCDPDDLVRMVVAPDGELVVDYRGKLPGRGAWVRPTRANLERLEKHPAILQKPLRCRVVTDGLLEKVRNATWKSTIDALTLTARSGGLVGGKDGVRTVLASGQCLGVLVAEDASPRLVADLRQRAAPLELFELPMTREELGLRIGKGDRAALAIRTGKAGRRLVRELRRLAALR